MFQDSIKDWMGHKMYQVDYNILGITYKPWSYICYSKIRKHYVFVSRLYKSGPKDSDFYLFDNDKIPKKLSEQNLTRHTNYAVLMLFIDKDNVYMKDGPLEDKIIPMLSEKQFRMKNEKRKFSKLRKSGTPPSIISILILLGGLLKDH